MLINLGEFEVISGELVVSDPCYKNDDPKRDMELGLLANLSNVRKGTWNAVIEQSNEHDWGMRVASLVAFHSDFPGGFQVGYSAISEEKIFECGVDSGQLGIFDREHYRDDAIGVPGEICPDEPWYSMCCTTTLGKPNQAGVIPFGVVSSSGFGDGCYKCHVIYNDGDGEVVQVKIDFIEEDMHEDMDLDWDEDEEEIS
jgi:hypothetical protein